MRPGVLNVHIISSPKENRNPNRGLLLWHHIENLERRAWRRRRRRPTGPHWRWLDGPAGRWLDLQPAAAGGGA